ncbi:uncharacterized protein TNCV_1957961 [Trichonephila clavipes]|nr:uncharacterized protein TNCV_1957961 [Trichonephila clavipes]
MFHRKCFPKRIDTLGGYSPPHSDTTDVRPGRVCREHRSEHRIVAKQFDIFLGIVALIAIHGKEFVHCFGIADFVQNANQVDQIRGSHIVSTQYAFHAMLLVQSGIFGALMPDFEKILVQMGIHQIGSLSRQFQDMGPGQMEGFRHAPQNVCDNSLKSCDRGALLPSTCIQKHGLDVRKQCVFCFGRRYWDHGQKNRPDHINHVVSCLKRFARDAKDYWAYLDQDDEDIVVEEENYVCECRHFQSIPRDMQDRPRMGEGFYESVLEKPDLWEEKLTFNDSSSLGKDVWGILRRYLRGEWVWFHIMVKHDVFETFRREMERIRDQCVLLHFWCLCDGLERGKIQHRHMILACEPECAFEEIWKGKVRQPKSSCDQGEIPDNLVDPTNVSHFHINRPLHPHSIATLCTLFSGGIEKLLWEQLGNKNVSSWEKVAKRVPDSWHNLRWEVQIRVTGWKFLNCWMPLHPRWEETDEWSEWYVTLYSKKEVHLKEGNNGTECFFQRIRRNIRIVPQTAKYNERN